MISRLLFVSLITVYKRCVYSRPGLWKAHGEQDVQGGRPLLHSARAGQPLPPRGHFGVDVVFRCHSSLSPISGQIGEMNAGMLFFRPGRFWLTRTYTHNNVKPWTRAGTFLVKCSEPQKQAASHKLTFNPSQATNRFSPLPSSEVNKLGYSELMTSGKLVWMVSSGSDFTSFLHNILFMNGIWVRGDSAHGRWPLQSPYPFL